MLSACLALGLWFVALVGCGGETDPERAYERARQHAAAERFEESLFEYRRAARDGHPFAMYELATVLRSGTFTGPGGSPVGYVGRDTAAARRWFASAAPSLAEAARSGDPDADLALGEMHYRGYGVTRDTTAALDHWRRAAAAGLAEAQYRLAMSRFEAGAHRPAFRWAHRAADQKHAAAESFLAFLYQDGYGTARDPDSAMVWLRRAATHGDSSAIWQLRALEDAGREPSE
ncbi:MAG TPA: tetratricopeptide repeat protein [Longibacter sp.]